MAAKTLNITIEQGATFTRQFGWYNPIAGTTEPDLDSPVVITGYTARMQLRTTYAASTYVLSLTSSPAAGITITGASGLVDVTITDEQTTVIEARDYVYDLELESPGGVVTRLVEGTATVTPEVTR